MMGQRKTERKCAQTHEQRKRQQRAGNDMRASTVTGTLEKKRGGE
jgi:hypothetical protein